MNNLNKVEYGNFETPNSERLYYVAIGHVVSIRYKGEFKRVNGPTQLLCKLPNNLKPVLNQRCSIYPYYVNLIVYQSGEVFLDAGENVNGHVDAGISFIRYWTI